LIFGIQLKEQIQLNYGRIKQDVKEIVSNEMERIKNDSKLKHLVKEDRYKKQCEYWFRTRSKARFYFAFA